jgi:hypothetical protein
MSLSEKSSLPKSSNRSSSALLKDNSFVQQSSSSIHRHGLFAKTDIPKGTRIIEYTGEKITKKQSWHRATQRMEEAKGTEDGSVYIFELNSRYDIDGNVSWNPARYINHSCKANCEAQVILGHIWIITTKDINEDTELSYDYGYDIDNWEEHPCHCGHSKCVGYIVRKDQRKKLKKLIKKRDAKLTDKKKRKKKK